MQASTFLRVALGALLVSLSAPVLAENAVTAHTANVLAGPDDSYPVVAQLDADTPVQVMGCLDDWSWCDVGFEDYRGWMYAPDLTYAYEGGYVPLYTYAPALDITVVSFSVDNYWGRYYQDRPWYSRREEFDRRDPMHHRRPEGPPPHHSPPPSEVVMHRPEHQGGIHLSSADSRHPDAGQRRDEGRRAESDRPGAAPDRADMRPGPRPGEHAAPARPDSRPETHARPPEHPGPSHEEQHGPAPHAAPPNREEPPPRPPSREERQNRPDHPDHPE